MAQIKCPECGAKGKDCGEHVGIIYECDGDFESICFKNHFNLYVVE